MATVTNSASAAIATRRAELLATVSTFPPEALFCRADDRSADTS
jgi:hypothetical protein